MSHTIPIHQLDPAHSAPFNARRFAAFEGTEDREEPHRHNYYELLFFSRGQGSHMIDFETHALNTTTLHFISPGQVHALNRYRGVEGYVVNFTRDFFVLNGGDPTLLNDFPAFNKTAFPVLGVSVPVFSGFCTLIDLMHTESKGDSPLKDQVMVSFIGLLLVKCKALLIDTPHYQRNSSAPGQLLQRFNTLLEDNYLHLRKVGDYAERLHLSPNHLSVVIKKLTGKTVADLIHERLLLEAKRLLLHSDLSAKEIAWELNFSDPPYFTRFFKSNTGFSPENFRKEVRKQYAR